MKKYLIVQKYMGATCNKSLCVAVEDRVSVTSITL